MHRILITTLFALFAVVSVAPVVAHAESEMEARVIVPDAPGGATFAGCYRAGQDLYGKHRFTFCLERRGTYEIRGENRCDGRLNWSVRGRDIHVDIHRASCRGPVAWERATMVCRNSGNLLKGIAGEIAQRVIVPNLPRLSALRCTYKPSVRGYRDTTFNARRL